MERNSSATESSHLCCRRYFSAGRFLGIGTDDSWECNVWALQQVDEHFTAQLNSFWRVMVATGVWHCHEGSECACSWGFCVGSDLLKDPVAGNTAA